MMMMVVVMAENESFYFHLEMYFVPVVATSAETSYRQRTYQLWQHWYPLISFWIYAPRVREGSKQKNKKNAKQSEFFDFLLDSVGGIHRILQFLRWNPLTNLLWIWWNSKIYWWNDYNCLSYYIWMGCSRMFLCNIFVSSFFFWKKIFVEKFSRIVPRNKRIVVENKTRQIFGKPNRIRRIQQSSIIVFKMKRIKNENNYEIDFSESGW